VKFDLGKMQAEIDKLNAAVDSLRKMMKKLGEQLSAGAGKGGGPIVMPSDSVSKEDFDKLVVRVDALELLQKQLEKIREELDNKASLHDLANL